MCTEFFFICFIACGKSRFDTFPMQITVEVLSEPELTMSDHLPLLEQLLRCVSTTIAAAGENSMLYSRNFFSILLRVAAVRHGETLKKQVCCTTILLVNSSKQLPLY